MNSGRGQSRIFKTIESAVIVGIVFAGPSGMGERVIGKVPVGAEIEVLVIKIPGVSVVHKGDSDAEINFRVGERLFGAQRGRESRSWGRRSPNLVVVDSEAVIGKNEAVTRAIRCNWPRMPVFVSEAAADGSIFIREGHALASIA